MRTFGSVSELSSTCQVPSDAARTYTSGTIGCTIVEPKARPGLGLRLRISAIMSARSSSSTPHSRRNAARSRLASRSRCSHQRPHRRIEAVAVPELDGETFGEIARAHAGRIERLQDGEHGLDVGARRAELVGDGVEIAGEVAGLVHHIDQVLPDHAAGRIGNRQRHLLGEMRGQRDLGGDESFQIIGAVLAAAGARAGPFRIGRRRHFRRRALLAAIVRKYVFKLGAEPLFHRGAAGLHVLVVPIGSASAVLLALGGGAFRLGGGRRRFVVVTGALEQRVFFELDFHVGGEIKAGELQQLDGLHQLRRHHQRLRLAELQSLRQRHKGFPAETGTILACFAYSRSRASAVCDSALRHCTNFVRICRGT